MRGYIQNYNGSTKILNAPKGYKTLSFRCSPFEFRSDTRVLGFLLIFVWSGLDIFIQLLFY